MATVTSGATYLLRSVTCYRVNPAWQKKETSARSCLPIISICPKLWAGKINHLVFDRLRLRTLDLKQTQPGS